MTVSPPSSGPIAPHVLRWRLAVRAVLARPMASFHLVVGLTAVLTGLGLVMVLAASNVDAYEQSGDAYTVFAHQLLYCALGAVLFVGAVRVPARRWRALSPWLLGLCLLALALVLVPGMGHTVAGAQKWFAAGPLSVEPSEPAKLALVLWGAHVLTARRRVLHRAPRALLPVVPVAVLMAGLVAVQPDLGTAICLLLVLFALLYFAGVSWRLLAVLAGGALAAVVVLSVTASYRLARLTSFLSPDALGPGYQERQALYALADGHLFGAGLGQGAAQWSYLPNASNDFIFAIIGEQLGLVGAVAVLALYGLLAAIGLRVAARTVDPWRRVVVATVTCSLVVQAGINVGYVLGLLPVTGITLPLVSSGGTSVVITLAELGLVAAAAREEPQALALRRTQAATRTSEPGWAGRSARAARRVLPSRRATG